jgi:hypothetical protein
MGRKTLFFQSKSVHAEPIVADASMEAVVPGGWVGIVRDIT